MVGLSVSRGVQPTVRDEFDDQGVGLQKLPERIDPVGSLSVIGPHTKTKRSVAQRPVVILSGMSATSRQLLLLGMCGSVDPSMFHFIEKRRTWRARQEECSDMCGLFEIESF